MASMHSQDMAVLKALVVVAWSDGNFAEVESQAISGLLAAHDASEAEKAEVHGFAAQPRTLDDINLQEISAADRRVLLQHAVLVTYAEKEPSPTQVAFLSKLAEHVKIPAAEAHAVINTARERVQKLLHLL
jgi:tellurite resistance protein